MPLQYSQTVVTGSINTSSVVIAPRPLQWGQAPFPLKVKRLTLWLFRSAKTFLISSKKPRNVHTVERPVAVTALWSIITTWSSYCFAKTSLISDDFPLPATPVTTVIMPRGISTSTFLRLWMFAPRTSKNPFGSLTFSFTLISEESAFPVFVPLIKRFS